MNNVSIIFNELKNHCNFNDEQTKNTLAYLNNTFKYRGRNLNDQDLTDPDIAIIVRRLVYSIMLAFGNHYCDIIDLLSKIRREDQAIINCGINPHEVRHLEDLKDYVLSILARDVYSELTYAQIADQCDIKTKTAESASFKSLLMEWSDDSNCQLYTYNVVDRHNKGKMACEFYKFLPKGYKQMTNSERVRAAIINVLTTEGEVGAARLEQLVHKFLGTMTRSNYVHELKKLRDKGMISYEVRRHKQHVYFISI